MSRTALGSDYGRRCVSRNCRLKGMCRVATDGGFDMCRSWTLVADRADKFGVSGKMVVSSFVGET
jgi:hypothetical protein